MKATTTPAFRFWKPPTGLPVATREATRMGSATRGKVEVYAPRSDRPDAKYLFNALPLSFFDRCEEITEAEALALAPQLKEYL